MFKDLGLRGLVALAVERQSVKFLDLQTLNPQSCNPHPRQPTPSSPEPYISVDELLLCRLRAREDIMYTLYA